MDIFDTHFHLLPEDDLSSIVRNAAAAGVTRMLVAGTESQYTETMLRRISDYPEVFAAIGVHPHEAQKFDGDLTPFRRMSGHTKVKAIGEIGLDFYYEYASHEVQIRVFNQFLELANEVERPVIIHCRDAFDACYDCLKTSIDRDAGFVIHCYTGTLDWAKRFIELGGYLSFTGILTFKNSDEIRDVMGLVPLDRLMFETDSPYLAPVPFRGKRNEPAFTKYIVERAAEELSIDYEKLIDISTTNARRFFKI